VLAQPENGPNTGQGTLIFDHFGRAENGCEAFKPVLTFLGPGVATTRVTDCAVYRNETEGLASAKELSRSRSAIRPGPVGFHPSFLRVCALEA